MLIRTDITRTDQHCYTPGQQFTSQLQLAVGGQFRNFQPELADAIDYLRE